MSALPRIRAVKRARHGGSRHSQEDEIVAEDVRAGVTATGCRGWAEGTRQSAHDLIEAEAGQRSPVVRDEDRRIRGGQHASSREPPPQLLDRLRPERTRPPFVTFPVQPDAQRLEVEIADA
jgi:hypothetical protein